MSESLIRFDTRAPSLAARFAEVAARHADRTAVWTRSERWTYRDLSRRAARAGAALRRLLDPSAGGVALLFSHGTTMIAGILGVLDAGRFYLPLDAAYPIERLRYMLDDSRAGALVTHGPHLALAAELTGGRVPVLDLDALLAGSPDEDGLDHVTGGEGGDPDRPAYLLYTSGSTGRPKGVMQTHRNVLYHVGVWTDNLRISHEDRLSLQAAYSWDSAVQDTFGALLNGAALCPVSIKEEGVGGVLDWLRDARVSVYHSTLPIFRAVAAAMAARGARLDHVRLLALGGDFIYASDVALYQAHFAEHAVLMNCYGATESSSALMNRLDKSAAIAGSVVPLGSPVAGTEVYLVGEDGARVEGAGEGEITLASPHLAPGYFSSEPEDQRRFAPDTAGRPHRVYRTGDLGRRLEGGAILLLGRKDFQVKISGIRVELGEVEGTLKKHPAVEDAVVLVREDTPGDRCLAAYVVLRRGGEAALPSVEALRAFLADKLPAHAVPARFTFLPALPLTVNAKIDRAALAPPDRGRPALSTAYASPRSELEVRVAALWRAVLALDDVGLDDNFFDLGGTSLRMAALHERVVRELDLPVKMVDMYRLPTIRAFVAGAARPGPGVDEADAAREAGEARGAARAQRAARAAARRREGGDERG